MILGTRIMPAFARRTFGFVWEGVLCLIAKLVISSHVV